MRSNHMVYSMTAFGRARKDTEQRSITAEIKSVNNRYLDITVKLPRLFGYLEEKVKSRITERGISRGKIDVFITIDVLSNDGVEVSLDKAYTQSYIDALKKLSVEYGIKDDITVSSVASNPAVFSVKKADEDTEKEWKTLLPVLDEAIDAFLAERLREGSNMKNDIMEKKATVMSLANQIAPLSKADVDSQLVKMKARIQELVGSDVALDESRLITECAIMADRLAIDEELVRLSSHFSSFDEIVNSDGPIGRKLDFLLQEINRETNTIGSKVNDASIAKIVVEMKSELEKIREQIQNIE